MIAKIFLLLFLVIGCKPRQQGQTRTAIDIGGETKQSQPAFSRCLNHLKQKGKANTPKLSGGFVSDYVISKDYEHKRSCIKVTVGLYSDYQRAEANGIKLETLNSRNAGNFEAAVSFLNEKNISCFSSGHPYPTRNIIKYYTKGHDKDLTFAMFKKNHRAHQSLDTENLTVSCRSSRSLHIGIGLNNLESTQLAMTIRDEVKKGEYVYHLLDINEDGMIVKHVEVAGNSGVRTVKLDLP